jgi:hypothetical protein
MKTREEIQRDAEFLQSKGYYKNMSIFELMDMLEVVHQRITSNVANTYPKTNMG